MTQEELDALMAGDIDETNNEPETVELNSDEHLVTELHDVTKDSEVKATEIMDKLDMVLNEADAAEKCIKEDETEKALILINDIRNTIFDAMSIMQYQDIHRQKIERVMNTMRTISDIMNNTLSSIDGKSKSFAPSAKHIAGDDNETMDDDELQALIAQMGN